MEKLSTEQKNTIKTWLDEGWDVGEVQKHIESDFGIQMTYMDVRFLIDDIGAEIKDKIEPQTQSDKPSPQPPSQDEPQSEEESVSSESTSETEQGYPVSNVSVSVSPIQRPGALASGDVVFSDGVKCEWILDQMGQLGLVPPRKDYQPPKQDMGDFQSKLQEELKKLY